MKPIILTLVIFGIITLSPKNCEGYRILGVFPLHVKSHFMMFEALMKGLARKGHQVDVVSHFPLKDSYPNYTHVVELPLYAEAFVNNITYEKFQSMTTDMVYFMTKTIANNVCEGLGHPDMLRIIRNPPKNPPYDLLITEVFSTHCFMALGYHLKVPVVGVSSTPLYPWGHGIIGNPANLAFAPNNLVNYVAPMTFWQRFHNTISAVYNDLYFQYNTTPQNSIIKKYLGEEAPSVREAERSLALILTNSHPALNDPRPLTPAVIEVSGLHIQDDGAELPTDLQKWMDDSNDGFIYFSFGSMVIVESFPEDVIRIFYKSLEKIAPVRVLMKILDPKKLPSGLPKNIRTFVWTQQYNVLKHKNVRAFMTHGGLMGTQEAIHCAVPMIGMPLFADQFVNVDLYTRKNIAVTLNYEGITEEKMDKALNEILFNPVYRNAVRNVSRKFRDRPMSSMDTATWWVEYAIRHGSDALRSPAMDLAWWQIELFDVYALLLLIIGSSIFVAVAVVRFAINISCTLLQPKVTHSKKVK